MKLAHPTKFFGFDMMFREACFAHVEPDTDLPPGNPRQNSRS
jgi:hypothetical protein